MEKDTKLSNPVDGSVKEPKKLSRLNLGKAVTIVALAAAIGGSAAAGVRMAKESQKKTEIEILQNKEDAYAMNQCITMLRNENVPENIIKKFEEAVPNIKEPSEKAKLIETIGAAVAMGLVGAVLSVLVLSIVADACEKVREEKEYNEMEELARRRFEEAKQHKEEEASQLSVR
ncbi:MAG: hypothetical protein LBH47_02655 [Christensenellaceae bacterium]|nr:hypothetical protein [Christensenellaceae bacterium]